MFFWKYPPSIIYIFLSRSSLYSTPKHYSYKPYSVQKPSSISAALVFLHLRLKWLQDNPMSRFSALNYESDTCIPLLHFSFFYLNRKSDTLMHVLFKKTTGTRDVCRASAFLHVPLKRFWSRWMSCSSALSHKSCIYISAALLSLSNLIASHFPRYICPKPPSLKRMFAALLSSSVCNSNAGCGALVLLLLSITNQIITYLCCTSISLKSQNNPSLHIGSVSKWQHTPTKRPLRFCRPRFTV